MNFDLWEPVYEEILSDFGFDRAADEHARDVLAEYARPFETTRFADLFGATVAVAGAGPNLAEELDLAREADVVFAASTAANVLLDAGVDVDVMVTDLDKNPETARALSHEGVPVAAHAHGDNVSAVEKWVPRFDVDHVLATTQAAPVGPVANFGGFTDGDRAAFLADAFGAAELVFPGWAFDDPSVDETKARKLAWAERLVYWLEVRRSRQFPILDGRRDELTLPESVAERY